MRCLPLQLHHGFFSHQISSIGAVARSPQELTPSEGPALRLQRAAIARRFPPAVVLYRDLDATVSGVTTTARARGDVRFRGKTGSRGLSVKPTRLDPKRTWGPGHRLAVLAKAFWRCSRFPICSYSPRGTGLFPTSVSLFEHCSGLI